MKKKIEMPVVKISIQEYNIQQIKIILSKYFEVDSETITQVNKYLNIINAELQTWTYFHHPENYAIIKEYNKAIRDLKKYTESKIQNITAITITTKKGSVTFNRNELTKTLFKNLFGGPVPDMSINGSFRQQAKYSNSDELILPVRSFEIDTNDEAFTRIVKDSIPFGKYVYENKGISKSKIHSLIMDLLFEFFNIERDENTIKQAFKNHFNKSID
jgi:hypothetical protein